MKHTSIIALSILVTFFYSCSDSTEKKQEAENTTSYQLDEVVKSVTFSQVLEGQWSTEGTEASSAQWREFDGSSKEFYSWVDGATRLSKPSGTYEVIGDTALQLSYTEYNKIVTYRIDSISENYMDLMPYGVSAGNFIYEKKEYQEINLKDVSKDTITVEGKVIKAFDSGMAYTLELHIDIGSDTLMTYYFTEKYSEKSLRDKHVKISYYKSLEYNYANPESITEEYEITGTYQILSYGGDIPGAYSVTNKNGRSVTFSAYLSKEDDKLEGTEVTERYTERYIINVTSIEVIEPVVNTLIFGDWNSITSDATPIGHQQIKIRPGGKKGVYIDFGSQGDNYVAADIYSNTLTGTNTSGHWKLELLSTDPAIFEYSDDGNGGHFEPIKNQKYQKKQSDNRKLLIGKWQGVKGTEGSVEFTDKQMRNGESDFNDPYVLSSAVMESEMQERLLGVVNNEVDCITTLYNGMGDLAYRITKLNDDSLSYTYMIRGNDFHFIRVK